MAVTNTPIFPQALRAAGTALLQTQGTWVVTSTATTSLVPVVAAGANGSVVNAVSVSCTDTATCTAVFVLGSGTAVSLLTSITVAGMGGTLAVGTAIGVLNGTNLPGLPLDSCGNKYVYLPPNWTLYVGVLNTLIKAASLLYVNAVGGDF